MKKKKSYKQFISGDGLAELSKKAVELDRPVAPIRVGETSSASTPKEPKEENLRVTTMTTGGVGGGIGKSQERANIERASFIVNQHTPEEVKKIYKSMNDAVKKEYEIHGIPVCIEWPAGQPRMYGKNNDKEGKTSYVDYGFFKGTKSIDGGGVDVYVGPQHESKKVFLLLQKPTSWDVEHGIIDPEPKYMLGFGSIDDAVAGYKSSMPDQWFLCIGEMTFDNFLEVIKVAQDRKSKIISKSLSGVSFDSTPGAEKRAAKAGLIILPDNISGTNCANCKFYDPTRGPSLVGFCTHKELKQMVGADFCCNHWDAEGAKIAKSVDEDEEWARLNGASQFQWGIEKSNNASADWRTGFKQTQAELLKYLEGEQSANATQQTDHTAEMSSAPEPVEKAAPRKERLELAEKLMERTPRATSEGIMSREHERKYNRTPLVRHTRLVDAGQTSAIPLFPNRLNTIDKNKKKILKSLLETPLPEEVKIIFNL
jgi:Inorganic Pyrophosphatase